MYGGEGRVLSKLNVNQECDLAGEGDGGPGEVSVAISGDGSKGVLGGGVGYGVGGSVCGR